MVFLERLGRSNKDSDPQAELIKSDDELEPAFRNLGQALQELRETGRMESWQAASDHMRKAMSAYLLARRKAERLGLIGNSMELEYESGSAELILSENH